VRVHFEFEGDAELPCLYAYTLRPVADAS